MYIQHISKYQIIYKSKSTTVTVNVIRDDQSKRQPLYTPNQILWMDVLLGYIPILTF